MSRPVRYIQFTLSPLGEAWGSCIRVVDEGGEDVSHDHDTLGCGESIGVEYLGVVLEIRLTASADPSPGYVH